MRDLAMDSDDEYRPRRSRCVDLHTFLVISIATLLGGLVMVIYWEFRSPQPKPTCSDGYVLAVENQTHTWCAPLASMVVPNYTMSPPSHDLLAAGISLVSLGLCTTPIAVLGVSMFWRRRRARVQQHALSAQSQAQSTDMVVA